MGWVPARSWKRSRGQSRSQGGQELRGRPFEGQDVGHPPGGRGGVVAPPPPAAIHANLNPTDRQGAQLLRRTVVDLYRQFLDHDVDEGVAAASTVDDQQRPVPLSARRTEVGVVPDVAASHHGGEPTAASAWQPLIVADDLRYAIGAARPGPGE